MPVERCPILPRWFGPYSVTFSYDHYHHRCCHHFEYPILLQSTLLLLPPLLPLPPAPPPPHRLPPSLTTLSTTITISATTATSALLLPVLLLPQVPAALPYYECYFYTTESTTTTPTATTIATSTAATASTTSTTSATSLSTATPTRVILLRQVRVAVLLLVVRQLLPLLPLHHPTTSTASATFATTRHHCKNPDLCYSLSHHNHYTATRIISSIMSHWCYWTYISFACCSHCCCLLSVLHAALIAAEPGPWGPQADSPEFWGGFQSLDTNGDQLIQKIEV